MRHELTHSSDQARNQFRQRFPQRYQRGFRQDMIIKLASEMVDGEPVFTDRKSVMVAAYFDTKGDDLTRVQMATTTVNRIKEKFEQVGEETARAEYPEIGPRLDYIRAQAGNEQLPFGEILDRFFFLQPVKTVQQALTGEGLKQREEELRLARIKVKAASVQPWKVTVPAVSPAEIEAVSKISLTSEQWYLAFRAISELPPDDYSRLQMPRPKLAMRLGWKTKAEDLLLEVEFSSDKLAVLTDLKTQLLAAKNIGLEEINKNSEDEERFEFWEFLLAKEKAMKAIIRSVYVARVGALIRQVEKVESGLITVPSHWEERQYPEIGSWKEPSKKRKDKQIEIDEALDAALEL
jgi:hypothetical protein